MNILTSIKGKLFGLGPADSTGRRPTVHPGGAVLGVDGKQRRLGGPNTVELFDDFIGDVIADQWGVLEGTDSGTTDAAVVAGGIGGVLRLTSGDAGTGLAADQVQIVQALQWQASNGDLCLETRFKISQITEAYAFIGFTDLAATLEAPVISAGSADTITTNASDAVGFMFDTRMTTDEWFMTGVKANTDATHASIGSAPVADTYAVFRIEVNADGDATFYYNGEVVGTVADAVTAGTDLTPTITIGKLSTTTSITADVDYVHVSMAR
jgi:hypothetical protein